MFEWIFNYLNEKKNNLSNYSINQGLQLFCHQYYFDSGIVFVKSNQWLNHDRFRSIVVVSLFQSLLWLIVDEFPLSPIRLCKTLE